MKKTVFIIYLVINSLISFSQKSGFVKLEQNKFEEAQEIFDFFLEENSENPTALMGLASLYSHPKYKNYSIHLAFDYIKKAKNSFLMLSQNEKHEISDICDEKKINSYFDNIEKALFDYSIAKGEMELKNFLAKNPETKFKTEIEKNLLLYTKLENLKLENSIEKYNQFITQNSNFIGIKVAEDERNKLAFQQAQSLNTQNSYSEFIEKYPFAQQIEDAYNERLKLDSIEILIETFRGNAERNFYGKNPPENLNLIWKLNLGSGQSKVKDMPKVWQGAGWTGQPLLVSEKGKIYLLQGAYDYNLRKIDTETGKVVWKYTFDDILKGTGTLWVNKKAKNIEERYIILQGSRYGQNLDPEFDDVVPSFRAISYISGKEIWKMSSSKTLSYSRDVDGSALIINDTAYIGLENGLFTVFNPNPNFAKDTLGIFQPQIYSQTWLYRKRDYVENSSNLVTESSPTLLKNRVFLTSGSGHVYGYNLKTKHLDWDYYIGADLDGSAVVSHDDKLLVSLEKEFIKGQGGVLKLNTEKPIKDCIEWFFPTENKIFGEWEGGIIGTVATNEHCIKENNFAPLIAFMGIDGWLYVIHNEKLAQGVLVNSPNLDKKLPTPEFVFKYRINPSISSPIFVGNKLIAASSTGIYLFEYDENLHFKLKASKTGSNFEASPIVWNKRIYIASRDGYLYCFGE